MSVEFTSRQHRLNIPAAPNTDDPVALKKHMAQMRQLMMDEFNRLSSDFYEFKKTTFEAGVIPLQTISNLAAVPTQFSVDATWENPQQAEITPTHVRVRILEVSPTEWAEYTYPITSWEFNGLTPLTEYTLQVQLIGRYETTDTFVSTTRNCPSVPVLRIAESSIKSKVFTTLDGVAPPTDPGLDPPDIEFPFPDPPTEGGPVGGSLCWWEYQFQVDTGDPPVWTDIGSAVEFDGTIASVVIDTEAAPFSSYENGVFRMKYRSVCNGVDGDWVYTPSFVKQGTDPCGDWSMSQSANRSPWSSADLWKIPFPCFPEGEWLQMTDGVSGTAIDKQAPGYGNFARVGNEWTVYSLDTSLSSVSSKIHVPLLSTSLAAIGTLQDEDDYSITIDFYLPELDLATAPLQWQMFDMGTHFKMFAIQRAGGTYDITVTVPRDGGGNYTLRGEGLAEDAWNTVTYTYEAGAASGRILYINGVQADITLASATTNSDMDGLDSSWSVNTFNLQRTRKMYGWRRALSPAEVASLMLSDYYVAHTFNSDEDPIGFATNGDDVVFSFVTDIESTPTDQDVQTHTNSTNRRLELAQVKSRHWDTSGTKFYTDFSAARYSAGDSQFQITDAETIATVVNIGPRDCAGGVVNAVTWVNGSYINSTALTVTPAAAPGAGDEMIIVIMCQISTDGDLAEVLTQPAGLTMLEAPSIWKLNTDGTPRGFLTMVFYGPYDTAVQNFTISEAHQQSQIQVFELNTTTAKLSGGDEIYEDATYINHTFLYTALVDDGELGALYEATGSLISPPATIDYFMVGGGGGGQATDYGGAGGGGEVLTATGLALPSRPSTVVVGDGGAGTGDQNTPGLNGAASTFSGLTAGGGSGGGDDYYNNSDANSLGANGGGINGDGTTLGGVASGGYGGGGGGSTAAGEDAGTSAPSDPGDGGAGEDNTWRDGSTLGYAGGGGGGGTLGGTAGVATHGGGAGGSSPTSGTDGRGGGGGGRHRNFPDDPGAPGGDGAVIIRYAKA